MATSTAPAKLWTACVSRDPGVAVDERRHGERCAGARRATTRAPGTSVRSTSHGAADAEDALAADGGDEHQVVFTSSSPMRGRTQEVDRRPAARGRAEATTT